MAIARTNYLNMPYLENSIIDLYKLGGIETKANGICHYCSTDVFKKIICNGSLRFTDIRCLKDTTEFVGIMQIIESVILEENYNSNFKEFILNSETLQKLRDYEQSYFDIIEEAHIPEEKLYCTYTCSFSTNDNSIRMWDEYAKEGVNICFDFAWDLFAGRKITDTNVRQKQDDGIVMYKGLIIYDEKEKKNCVKKVLNNLEKVYLEVQNVRDQYANFLFYAFKEAVNYMRCFFKNKDYDYEEEYRIVLKVPKDIIKFRRIEGEIKDIGIDEKDRDYIDYKIQRKGIKQVAISPFLSKADADKAECEANALFRLNKLEHVKTVHMSIFPFSKLLDSHLRKKSVENLALGMLQYCYGNTYDGFAIHDAPDISDDTKTVGIEVTEAIDDDVACINGEFNKYRLENNMETKERKKQIIEKHGGTIEEWGLSYPDTDSNFEKIIIQSALRKKMKKLPRYKKKGFKTIGLFIFLNGMPIPVRLETFKNYFDEVLNEYNEKYDIIYFGYSCGLMEYDVVKGNIQAQVINRADYDKLQYEARLKVEADINDEL